MTRANLQGADLTDAILVKANLSGARADHAIFQKSIMVGVTVGRSDLPDNDPLNLASSKGADFTGAILTDARFFNVDFGVSPITEKAANPEKAKKLDNAEFVYTRGLTEEQKTFLRERNAKVVDKPSQVP